MLAAVGAIAVVAVVLYLTRDDLLVWWRLRADFQLRSWRNAQGYSEYRHRATGIVMVVLPGGTFVMGSPPDKHYPRRPPPRRVTLSPFLIAKHEVTQEIWLRIMKSRPSRFQGTNLPVEQVSWEDAQEFCRLTGLELPSVAQWEYACRAGREWGTSLYERLEDVAWCRANSGLRTHPVGTKQPNDFGLHDTLGNVWEWCRDALEPDSAVTTDVRQRDPVSAPKRRTSPRVFRGGGWSDDSRLCTPDIGGADVPSGRGLHLGFRPVYLLSR